MRDFEASVDSEVYDIEFETNATLDGWANGWVYFGDEPHQRLRHQQKDRGIMLWAVIIVDTLFGLVRMPE